MKTNEGGSGARSDGARDLVWRDLSVYESRREKSARALVRLAKALKRDRLLDGEETEFLALFDRFSSVDPQAFTAIWSEPFAYYWARTADELLTACLDGATAPFVRRYLDATGALTAREALVRHLELFKLLAIGFAAQTGQPWRLEAPLRVELPVAIVGTPYSLSGEGVVLLRECADGELRVEHRGRRVGLTLGTERERSVGGLTLHRCPEIRLGDATLRMQPHALKLPDLVSVQEDPLPTMETQHGFRDCVAEAIDSVERYLPVAADQIRAIGRLAVVKPRTKAGPTNASFSRLPGAVLFSARRNPLVIADDLIHEVHHNRLYALEEGRPLFDNEAVDGLRDARFYSPWRADPRPLYGIFHAVYVFTRVARFWLGAYRSGDLGADDRAYATERLVRFREQLTDGLATLRREARFTDFGETVFEALEEAIAELLSGLRDAGVPDDAPAWVALEGGGYERELGLDTGEPITVLEAIEEHHRHYRAAAQAAATAAGSASS